MKKCVNCGFENPDEATSCQSCNTGTFASSSPEAMGGHVISPAEHSVWERMTFRQFTILFIRFQSLFFLVYAIDDATYLPAYLTRLHAAVGGAYSYEKTYIFWLCIRILGHVAAFVACIRYADRVASWLVRDSIPKQPPYIPSRPPAVKLALVILLVHIGSLYVLEGIRGNWDSFRFWIKMAMMAAMAFVPLWFVFRGRNWARWLLVGYAVAELCLIFGFDLPRLSSQHALTTAWIVSTCLHNAIDDLAAAALFLPSSSRWFLAQARVHD
jgi:hypothetical protein